jgi:hypothetical protein
MKTTMIRINILAAGLLIAGASTIRAEGTTETPSAVTPNFQNEKEKLEAFRELCAEQPAMYSRVLAKLTEIRNSAHGKTSRDRTGPDTPSDGSGPAAEAG